MYFFVLSYELKHIYITSSALRDPDVQVETVFTAHNISSEKIELQAPLSVVCGFQNTCAGRASSSALSIHSLILDPSCAWKHLNRQVYSPSQPGWGTGFSNPPGGVANGIPLNTSI